MTTLIVLPLQAEVDILAEALVADGLRLKHAQAGRLPLLAFPEIGAALARGGHGKAQFALHTRHLLDHAGHVDLIVCAGAAGRWRMSWPWATSWWRRAPSSTTSS